MFSVQTASWLRKHPNTVLLIEPFEDEVSLSYTDCHTTASLDVKRVICEVLFFIERARLQQNK